jgi:hypothetical protein
MSICTCFVHCKEIAQKMAEKLSLCGNLYTGYRPFCENAKTGENASSNHPYFRDQASQ